VRVVVVGAGVGGLTAAIDLAHAGHRVTVLEQMPYAGGKCCEVRRGAYRWDAGPSLLTMPDVFRGLFADTGGPLDAELELLQVEPVTRYRFADGTSVELSADRDRSIEALEAWAPGAGREWARFLSVCADMWAASERFLTGPPPWPPRRDAAADPRDGLRVQPWRTLRGLARSCSGDRRLQMIIERFATYAGADPRRAPAALAVAGYVEHAFGAWHPRGGVARLVDALTRRLEALGGELRLRAPVERILVQHGRVRGVATADGTVAADAVVADVDEAVVRHRLLGDTRRRRRGERSLSGLALMLGLRGRTPGLAHHEIRFPADPDAEFDDVFTYRRPVLDPTIYVSTPGVTDPEAAESWFVLVNAPAIGAAADWDAAAGAVVDRLGVRERLVEQVTRTPADLAAETGAVGGAIYGFAPHGRLGALRRPGQRVRGIDGLWLAGGTVHPGGGLPLVALGGRTVARAIGPA
jgi:phytoene desaturase